MANLGDTKKELRRLKGIQVELVRALKLLQLEMNTLLFVGRTAIDSRPECDWERACQRLEITRAVLAKVAK